MTPKERAAMQQALEALEEAYENGFLTGVTGLKTIDTITALREALAKPDIEEMTLTQIAARHEQAEQEPVAEVRVRSLRGNESVPKIDVEWLVRPTPGFLYAAPVRTKDLTDEDFVQSEVKSLRQQVAALKAVLDAWNNVEQEPVAWPIHGDIAKRIADKQCVSYEVVQLIAREIMAAPIRTKDLTDDEIRDAVSHPMTMMKLNDARAVIAKLKEKTNG